MSDPLRLMEKKGFLGWALPSVTIKWKNPPVTWKVAATQFAIGFGQRFFAVEIWKREANHCQSQKDKRWALEPIGSIRDLPTIAFFRVGTLLQRNILTLTCAIKD
jgi:hypothetical protein